MTRKLAMRRIAPFVVFLLLVTACSSNDDGASDTTTTAGAETTAATTDGFDWRQFDGEKITLLFNEHPWTAAVEESLDDFESLTGISVDLQTYSEELFLDRAEAALRGSEGLADVYFQTMDDQALTQWSNDLVAPLGGYLNDPSLTSPDYDVADFEPALLAAASFPLGEADAQPYAIPISTETYILFYNKELVDQYLDGVVPATTDELVAAAEQITAEAGGDVFGSVMRGVRETSIRDTLTGVVLNSFGNLDEVELPYNLWFDGSFDNPRLDDPRIVDGMTVYSKLVAAGPANFLALDWPDAVALFSQGKAAFFADASVFGPGFEDPEASLVAGNVGYAPIPPSEAGQATGLWSWGLSIPANSNHKEAAWLFIQWATNKANTALFGTATGGAPRTSAGDSQVYSSAFNPEYVAAVQESLGFAFPATTYLEGWTQHDIIIVDAMQSIAQGEDPTAVMTQANIDMKASIGN